MKDIGCSIGHGEYGVQYSVTGSLDSRVASAIAHDKPSSLVLSYTDGWKGDGIEKIENMTWLEHVVVIHHAMCECIPLARLDRLRSLTVSVADGATIDGMNSRVLQHVDASWKLVKPCIASMQSVLYARINDFVGERDLAAMVNLIAIRQLRISGARLQSLAGINGFRDLDVMMLQANRSRIDLSSLCGLGLRWLHLEAILGVDNMKEAIVSMPNLLALTLESCGDIETLRFIINASKLQRLCIGGRTNIVDGHVDFLRQLPSLRAVFVDNRRHYDAKDSDFGCECIDDFVRRNGLELYV